MATGLVQVRLIIDPLGHCLQEMPVGEHREEARDWASWSDCPGFEVSLCQLKTVGHQTSYSVSLSLTVLTY